MLADFGIARRVDDSSALTATNMTVGTVAYAAPEQLMGEDARRPRRPVRAGRDGLSPADRLAAVSALQPGGRHQPAPHRVTTGDRRPSSRVVGARSGAGQGTVEGSEGPVQQLRRLRTGAGPPTRGRAGGRQRPHRSVDAPRDRSRAGAGTKPSRRRGGNTCGPRSSCRRSWLRCCLCDRPRADPVPRDREAAQRRLHRRRRRRRPRPRHGPRHRHRRASTRRRRRSPPRCRRLRPAAVVGADCSPVGSTATTANGNTVYCSTLESTGATIWSTSQGEVPAPTVTVTTEVTDEPLPIEEETPVRVCMQETGRPGGSAARRSGPATKAATERRMTT